MRNFRTIWLIVCLCLFWAMPIMGQTQLALDAAVNNNPVKLLFDTGAEVTFLFKKTATRLNLQVTEPDPSFKLDPGQVLMQLTEECEFTLSHININTQLRVYDPPNWVDYGADGILAWSNVKSAIFHFALEKGKFGTLTELPEDIASWAKWKIGPDKRLIVQLPKPNDSYGSILIDTGAPFGVCVNAKRWTNWRNCHPKNPATLTAYFAPGSGLVIREECWTNCIELESFLIQDVPVMQSSPDVEMSIENFDAVLGWYALSRFDIIIDGANSHFYTKPIERRTVPYSHNRLGAVFVPTTMSSNDLVATVVEGTPAWAAGIRNGDVLLSIGDLDVTKWRTDPNVLPLRRFWECPAGTILNLTYTRNGTVHKAPVILWEILVQSNPVENN